MHEEDREVLKQSVRNVITTEGRGKTSRKKFKRLVTRSMARTSTLRPIKLTMAIEDSMELIEELWKEVSKEMDAERESV